MIVASVEDTVITAKLLGLALSTGLGPVWVEHGAWLGQPKVAGLMLPTLAVVFRRKCTCKKLACVTLSEKFFSLVASVPAELLAKNVEKGLL